MKDENYFYNPTNLSLGAGNYLVPSKDWEIEKPPEPINFFGITRGIARFGLLFSAGLSATLFVRLLPVLMPGYVLLLGASASIVAVYAALSRQTSTRITVLIIGVTIAFGIVGGAWDAARAYFSEASGQEQAIQVSTVVVTLLFAVAVERAISSSRTRS